MSTAPPRALITCARGRVSGPLISEDRRLPSGDATLGSQSITSSPPKAAQPPQTAEQPSLRRYQPRTRCLANAPQADSRVHASGNATQLAHPRRRTFSTTAAERTSRSRPLHAQNLSSTPSHPFLAPLTSATTPKHFQSTLGGASSGGSATNPLISK
jgi:hypothetical protein